MALTEYGKVVREVREALNCSLRDMATGIDYSPTFVSACEMGDKTITDDFLAKVAGYLRRKGAPLKDINRVCGAADRTRNTVDVSRLDGRGRQAVAAFAR